MATVCTTLSFSFPISRQFFFVAFFPIANYNPCNSRALSYIGHDNDDRNKMIRFFSFDGSLVNLKGNVVEVTDLTDLFTPALLSFRACQLICNSPTGPNCSAAEYGRKEAFTALLFLCRHGR
jgi:hypothetical protein